MFRVLIADDLEILRFDLKRMNIWGEASGFILGGEASNGLEALKMLRAASFDLVITDIRMPVMDGIELLKTITQEGLCPCVVLLSDYTEFTYARQGLVHGAFDYLGKPITRESMEELLGRVRRYLEKREQEQEKLRKWENLAGEAFFPTADVERMAALLNQGDKEALDAAEQLVNTVGAAMNYDVTKSSILLKNATDAVFSRVVAENEWIGLYLDISDFKKLDLEGIRDWPSVGKKVKALMANIQEFLHRFILWGKGSGTVKSACLHVLYHVEEDISVKNAAEKLFISKAHLSEFFKQSTGIPLLEYITSVKVERAKHLIKTSQLKNYEIAEKLGFNDHEYFSKIFKKHTGFPPGVFRKETQ